MRMKLLLIIACSVMLYTIPGFADSIAYRLSSNAPSRCCAPPPPPPCTIGPPYGCKCNDQGVYWNNCITTSEYCEAFGNIGGMRRECTADCYN